MLNVEGVPEKAIFRSVTVYSKKQNTQSLMQFACSNSTNPG